MDPSVDLALIERYITGECTPAERSRVEHWLAADPSRRTLIDAFGGKGAAAFNPDAALSRVKRRPGFRRARPPRIVARPATWSAVRIAASIALVAGGIFAAWRAGWLGVAQPIREFASAVGSRTTITLRDGTTLVLGPATRLRVPADFGRSARVVELDGEGLFTVVHDARRPFIVHAGRTTIRDIGTVFTVHAYAGDPEQRIAVAEGSVALAGTTLRQGDVASVDRDGRVAVRQSSDLSTELGWAQGTLAFRGTPLGEVVHVLARTYGLHITVADSALNAAPVTATFTNESPDAVLEVVTYVVGAHYQRSGHDIVIHRGAALAAPDLRITGSKR